MIASAFLTISFSIWALYAQQPGDVFGDCDAAMRGLRERGFNCIRMDDGAGLYAAPDGTPRGPVRIRPAFGRFSGDIRQMNLVTTPRTVDPRANLVRICRAADRHGIRVILSSWFFIHTTWMVDESVNGPIFEGLSDEGKIAYFTDELDRALKVLEDEKLAHVVAFAELFNEFDGLYFTARYGRLAADKAERFRALHEAAIGRLKKAHPSIRFGYDASSASIQEELVPRNADVLNFHHYYFWPIYQTLEHRSVRETVVETPIPPETAQYLRQPPLSIAEVVETRCGNLRVSNDWNARVRLYASLDDAKMPALEAAFDEVFARERETYVRNLKDGVARVVALRDRILPGVPIVFGEGVSYVAGMRFLYEEKSERYWRMLEEQSRIFRGAGLYGAVPRTNSGPEEPGWQTCAEKFRRVNDLFKGK